jgi:hypothetical protein
MRTLRFLLITRRVTRIGGRNVLPLAQNATTQAPFPGRQAPSPARCAPLEPQAQPNRVSFRQGCADPGRSGQEGRWSPAVCRG